MGAFRESLTFYLNGTPVELHNPDPDVTLLQYLRSIGLTGTKLGCAEGGCGACTVLVSSFDRQTGKVVHVSVNACLVPLCSVDGRHVITIEGVGSTKNPHPIQERIAMMHGSQCGFCTPGIVMSLYALLRNKYDPSEEQIEECFDGNLCRCTGYRPILDAAKTFVRTSDDCCKKSQTAKDKVVTEVNGCGQPDCCKRNVIACSGFAKIKFKDYDPKQDLIFPPQLMKYIPQSLYFHGKKTSWYRPLTLSELLKIKKAFPHAKLVAGNTEVGIETKFKKKAYNTQVYTNDVPELKIEKFEENGLAVGANISLTSFQEILQKACHHYEPHQVQPFQALLNNIHWFAGNQIRNVATPAGNIVTGSPISDMNPIFLATNSIFTLASLECNNDSSATVRRSINAASFWTGYRQTILSPSEVLECIYIPCSTHGEFIRAYKQAKRRDDDIAIVNACLRVVLDKKNVVTKARFAYGGMGGQTVCATLAENAILGRHWGEEHMLDSLLMKLNELRFSAPGGMASYRCALAAGFMHKFWHDVAYNVDLLHGHDPDDINAITGIVKRGLSGGFQNIGKLRENNAIVGQSLPHLSALKQVTGEAIYVDDLPKVHGELYGALVLSQKAHAKILSIDASKALECPGVHGFFSAEDVPGENTWGPVFQDEEVFAKNVVHCVGQIVGLVVADSQSLAKEAVSYVDVQYEELPHILTIEQAIQQKSYFPFDKKIIRGNVNDAFDEADCVLEGESRVGGQEHFYLETQASLVIPKPEDCEFEIHASTQNPSETQMLVASALGISANKVVCHVKRLGGGFGGKETRSIPLTLALSIGAWHLRKPIRCMLDRDEDITVSGQRHPLLGQWKVGIDKNKKIIALDMKLLMNAGWSTDLSAAVLERAMTHCDNCYYIPNMHVTGKICKTNTVSNTAFRGFGGPQAMFVTESMISEIADHFNIDVNNFRELNMYTEGQKTHFNQTLTEWHLPELYKQLKKTSEFSKRQRQVDEFNKKHAWRKRGLALVPTKFGLSYTALHLNQAGSLVHIYQDGSVLISHGGVEMGQGLHTKIAQIASEMLSVPVESVHLIETSTSTVANASTTAASVSSDINGYAVVNACQKLAKRLQPYRQKMPNAAFKEICKAAYFDRVNLSANGFYKTPDIGYNWEKNEGQLFFYFTTGAAISEVEIDALTGDHQIIQTDLCMDIGNSLNHAIDIGQIEGAFIQGVGWCTIEELLFFPNGQVFTKGPGNYKIPGFRDIPQKFHISIFKGNQCSLKTIYSSKGIGEPPLFLGTSVFFAIRDAIKAVRKSHAVMDILCLRSPATSECIRMACEDHLIQKTRVVPQKGENDWVVSL